jgi:hypothetical protein
VLTLAKMSAKEARALKIGAQERDCYVRVDVAKFNLGKKPETVWLKINGVQLPNGEDVGAPERWYPPSEHAEVSLPAMQQVLNILSGEPAPGEQYTVDQRAKDRWAGTVLIRELGQTDSQAKKTLAVWAKSGMLAETTYVRPNRNRARGLSVDISKLPVHDC